MLINAWYRVNSSFHAVRSTGRLQHGNPFNTGLDFAPSVPHFQLRMVPRTFHIVHFSASYGCSLQTRKPSLCVRSSGEILNRHLQFFPVPTPLCQGLARKRCAILVLSACSTSLRYLRRLRKVHRGRYSRALHHSKPADPLL
jgi:hypothetical protein